MTKPAPPLFLARKSYRRRRMMDAARLLPLIGVFALMLPILWEPRLTAEPDTVFGLIYVFCVWALLIVAARGLARVIMDVPPGEGSDEGPGDEDGAA
jgi:peptidoglycan/LPS O-acetylase OafA/YrhL